ncbi:hypothetical protein [Aeromicrobium wangtongii]|uniref:FHA domain-containing protein n=1 Tax=Aeromicrobium wangtongii TaxID=2969247 RepID=A0ABY5MA89_9ACTN|nr:hypothetical protein [Aeromicrobium wangtongii]MCD9199316.1 hypothetical protein [Aeromicrobium wangtongii]UUP13677.1 hypothetical protein NQV15_17780 [Aeromicrobium wangtongii]
MTRTRAEVRVVVGFGLDIEMARQTRVRIDAGGDLVVSRPGASPRVVARSTDVTKTVWLDGSETARIFAGPWSRLLLRINRGLRPLAVDGVPVWMMSGSCVVLTDRGPVAAWLIDETAPTAGDPSHKRHQSGSVALARGLGGVLEPASPDVVIDRRAVRRVAVRGSTMATRVPVVESLAVLAALILSGRAWAGFDGDDVRVGAVLALVLAVPVAIGSVVRRQRAIRLMSTPPEPRDRVVYRPPGRADGDLVQLQLGPDDVVAVSGAGSEIWLPGPAVTGGVARIQVVHDQLMVLGADGGLLQLLPTDRFAPDVASCEALDAAAAPADVRVDILEPPPGVAAPPAVSELLRRGSWQNGDASPLQAWLLGIVGLFLVVAGLATGDQHPLLGRVVSAGGVLVVAAWVWTRWALRHWVRSVERRVRT